MLNFFQLPYKKNVFGKYLSQETLDFHYEKHHQAYFDNLIKLISGTELEKMSLEEIIKKSFNQPNLKLVFNNAAQVFNHNFYWNSLTPEKKNPSKFLVSEIEKNFDSMDSFKEDFKKKALAQFGSGWAWVVLEGERIKIITTSNANNPLTQNQIPLICLDVWEHAYYIDYRNKRGDYLNNLIENLINWDFFEKNLKSV
jgi:Fe-Mn family superoxide dismutase